MYYKVWKWDFIEHVWISHSILSHFLDRGFLGWRAQSWASIVLCPTNNTQQFGDIQIDRRTCGLVGWTLHFYYSLSSKQHSKVRDIQIDGWTPGLAGSRLPLFTDGKVLKWAIPHLHHRCYIKGKSISSIVLCPTNNTQSSALYKLTVGLAG